MRSAVYSVTRVLDTRHNPEFTTDGAVSGIHRLPRHDGSHREPVPPSGTGSAVAATEINYKGIEMDLGKPFERLTMVDAVKKYVRC